MNRLAAYRTTAAALTLAVGFGACFARWQAAPASSVGRAEPRPGLLIDPLLLLVRRLTLWGRPMFCGHADIEQFFDEIYNWRRLAGAPPWPIRTSCPVQPELWTDTPTLATSRPDSGCYSFRRRLEVIVTPRQLRQLIELIERWPRRVVVRKMRLSRDGGGVLRGIVELECLVRLAD